MSATVYYQFQWLAKGIAPFPPRGNNLLGRTERTRGRDQAASKREAHSNLYISARPGRRDGAEIGVGHAGAQPAEIRNVEEIKEIDLRAQLHLVGHGELLTERHIPILQPRSQHRADADRSPPGIRRADEGPPVEVLIDRLIAARKINLAPDIVRPPVSDRCKAGDREILSGLKACDAAPLPA